MSNPQPTVDQYRTQVTHMFGQSIDVLKEHNVTAFERFKRQGGVRQTAIYIGLAVAVAAVFQVLFSLIFGFNIFIEILTPLITIPAQFFAFTGLVYLIGKNMYNATGTFDEVAYSFSLFFVPLSILGSLLGAIPFLGILAVIPVALAEVWYGRMAAEASLNISDNKSLWITLLLSMLGVMIIGGIIGSVLAAMAFSSMLLRSY